MRVRFIGGGRAGGALARALGAAGWEIAGILGRNDPVEGAAQDVDWLVIATPDGAIAEVASRVEPTQGTLVVHLAGALGPGVLGRHSRRAGLHPLLSLPDPDVGSARLAGGAWFAVAGDEGVRQAVEDLGGRAFAIRDEDRAAYHAAACIASNHLVALLGQVERVGGTAGVPLEAYLELARGTLDNVARLGPAAALTGPVARGDQDTVARHLEALDPSERGPYEVMAACARRLAVGDD